MRISDWSSDVCSSDLINPLAVTDDGKLVVLDAKVGFDSNAMFRHADLMELRDETEEDPMELEASKYDLAYIKLDGNIGCMVNGAGLAMATMDIIKLNGAFPKRSEEHTSELQSLMRISYAVFCLKKKKI